MATLGAVWARVDLPIFIPVRLCQHHFYFQKLSLPYLNELAHASPVHARNHDACAAPMLRPACIQSGVHYQAKRPQSVRKQVGRQARNSCELVCRWQAAKDLHVTCITLGSPLVGDARFADLFLELDNFACYRIVHGMDPVPLVPPSPWGFVHVGRPIWLQKNMVVSSTSPPQQCSLKIEVKLTSACRVEIEQLGCEVEKGREVEFELPRCLPCPATLSQASANSS